MKRLQIGLTEIGIFSTSLAMMGLIFWFLSLTLFGSSKNSEARLLVSMGASIPASNMAPAALPSIAEAAQAPAEALPAAQQSAAQEEPSTPAPAQEAPVDVPVPQSLESWSAALDENKKEIPEPEPPKQMESAVAAAPIQEEQITPASVPPLQTEVIAPPTGKMEEAKVKDSVEAASVFVPYNPSKGRDPMLKPEEVEIMRLRKEEMDGMAKRTKKSVGASPVDVVKRRINVQGIMDTPEGVVAIINNEIYSRGQTVAGSKILRILGNRVQFKYGSNIFEKKVNND